MRVAAGPAGKGDDYGSESHDKDDPAEEAVEAEDMRIEILGCQVGCWFRSQGSLREDKNV